MWHGDETSRARLFMILRASEEPVLGEEEARYVP